MGGTRLLEAQQQTCPRRPLQTVQVQTSSFFLGGEEGVALDIAVDIAVDIALGIALDIALNIALDIARV